MPIYEYQCQECSKELEALQKISEAPLVDCPECGASALKKKVSAAAFRLKGGGWYETDFKDKNKRNLAGDAGSGSADSSDSGKKTNLAKDSGKSGGSDSSSSAAKKSE